MPYERQAAAGSPLRLFSMFFATNLAMSPPKNFQLSVALLLSCATLVLARAPQWKLSWADEFDEPVLNTTLWTVRHNRSHCCDIFGKEELQLYIHDAISLQNGELHIRTRYNPTMGVRHDGSLLTDYLNDYFFGHSMPACCC